MRATNALARRRARRFLLPNQNPQPTTNTPSPPIPPRPTKLQAPVSARRAGARAPCSRPRGRASVRPVVAAAKHEYSVVKEERSDGSARLTVTVPGPLVQKRFAEIVDIMRR